MPHTLRLAKIMVGTLVIGYALWGAAGVIAERPMLFPVPGRVRSPPPHGGAILEMPGVAGTILALHMPAPAGAPTIVFFHGNAEQLSSLNGAARVFQAAGLGYFAVEYPGYGYAAGSPSEDSLFAAGETAVGYLRDVLHVPVASTVLLGWSLGTGVAAEMAIRGHGVRLMLVSPYTSIADVGKNLLPFHPTRWIVRDPFDTAAKAARIAVPTLIVHGLEDEIIPVAMGERLGTLFSHAATVLVTGPVSS